MATILRSGTIRTIAGTGDPGYAGDGGQPDRISLNEPKGTAIDSLGNVLIVDSENHVIRRIDRITGIISTVAGVADGESLMPEVRQEAGAFQPMSEDPFAEMSPAMQNYGQQADLSGTVRYIINGTAARDRFGGDGGPATGARLNFPTAVVIDGRGNLYIADTMNHRIRFVEAGTGMISTLAGVGQPRYSGDGGPAVAAGLNEPAALALDGRGTLYVADQSNNRVRAIDLETRMIRTAVGTGSATYNGDGMQATVAAVAGPSGLACADDGTLFIADTFNGRIRAVDPATGLIRTVAGDGGEYRYQGDAEPPSASLSRPSGIAVDQDGNLYLTDSDNHLIRKWNRGNGVLERVAGVGATGFSGDGGPALQAALNYPFGIAVDRDGRLVVADTFNHRLREIAQ
ncbi:MAG: PQQ-binding-like beta-propeller repeat protein [Nitrospira sp.]|nr:PQQ-binding-like beta-propeller repeat protein [Nitrospira sp.]